MLHFEGGSNRGFRLPITHTIADTYHGLQAKAGSVRLGTAIHWLEANIIGLVVLTMVLAIVAGLGWTAVAVAPIVAVVAIVGQWLLFD